MGFERELHNAAPWHNEKNLALNQKEREDTSDKAPF